MIHLVSVCELLTSITRHRNENQGKTKLLGSNLKMSMNEASYIPSNKLECHRQSLDSRANYKIIPAISEGYHPQILPYQLLTGMVTAISLFVF